MHHILITHTRRNITFYSTFLSGYPITKDEFRTAGKTGKRAEAEGRAVLEVCNDIHTSCRITPEGDWTMVLLIGMFSSVSSPEVYDASWSS